MDNVISRYPGDSTITSFLDTDNNVCVHTNSFQAGLNNACTKIKMILYEDWGEGNQQARVTYKLCGAGGEVAVWQIFTNLDSTGATVSNAYTGCHSFVSSKYLFWYFCDQNGLTII
jgi:hypothetical protein